MKLSHESSPMVELSDDSSAPSSYDSEKELTSEELRNILKNPPEGSVFIRFSYTNEHVLNEICTTFAYYVPIVYDLEHIKVKLTQDQKIQNKKLYRQEYRNRPEVRAKIEQDRKDPEKIKKRKEYSSQPKVKERKRILAKARRQYIAEKNKDPQSDYKAWLMKHVPPIDRKTKKVTDESDTKA